MSDTPIPGDLSARLLVASRKYMDAIEEVGEVSPGRKLVAARNLRAAIAALSALPAAGGAVATVSGEGRSVRQFGEPHYRLQNIILTDPEGSDLPPGTKLYTTPQPSAAVLEDGGPPCSTHPDAPHGFNRNASHTEDRYVCDCEGWKPDAAVGAQGEVEWLAYVCRCAADMIERRESPCYVNDLRRASDLIRRLATTPQPSAAEDADTACYCMGPDVVCPNCEQSDAAAGAQGDGEWLLSIIDEWMDNYDHMGTGCRATERNSEREWKKDRQEIEQIIRRLAAPAAGKGVEAHARELLAVEYERGELLEVATIIRRGNIPAGWKDDCIALRAISAALTRQPVAGDGK